MKWGVGGVIVATILLLASRRISLGLLSLAVGLAVLSWLGRCRHPGRPGLLPPRTAADGTRIPARWFCDRCGESWPANLEHERQPILKFAGYDESKAPRAAQRAAELERRRQDLALRRAGLTTSRAPSAKQTAGARNVAASSTVVPIAWADRRAKG
jgi:hypothetical protein